MAIQIEDLQYQLTRFEDWVKNADIKIGVILAFDGVILAAILKHALSTIFNSHTPYPVIIGYIVCLVLLILSIEKAFLAVLPRLKHRQNMSSPLFFSDVSKLDFTEYKHMLGSLSTSKYREEMIAQIHAIAKIADTRMVLFRDSILLLMASLMIAGVTEVWLRLINL